ncbi:MAG: hypothetical protein AAF652_18525 [Cyanobacteria bacterium P01_C01_bin.72]
MLLAVILVLLLIGNWFFTETLIFIPVDLAINFASLGWWTLALLGIGLIAWCVGDD